MTTPSSLSSPMPQAAPAYEIERELQHSAPRRVRDTAETRRVRRIVWNSFLAAFCLLYFLATMSIAPLPLLTLSRHHIADVTASQEAERTTLNYLLGVVLAAGMLGLLKVEAYYASRRRLLRWGETAIATVVERRLRDGMCYLTYRFYFSEYKIYGNEVRVTAEQYEQYGEGEPITVLFPYHESYASELYIAVTQAEIVGAASRSGKDVG